MRSTSYVFASAALLVPCITALPFNITNFNTTNLASWEPIVALNLSSGTFTLGAQRLDSNGTRKRSLQEMNAAAYAKHGLPEADKLDWSLKDMKKRGWRDPVSVADTYISTISIGNPPVEFKVFMDTGSPDTWVDGINLASDQKKGQTLYDARKSSTSKSTSSTFKQCYGDGGCASGGVVTELVQLGDIAVSGYPLEIADQDTQRPFDGSGVSGMMGLNFATNNAIAPNHGPTFFQTIKGALASQLFTLDLQHGGDGRYNFGWIDDSAHKGSITYSPISGPGGEWLITPTGFELGGVSHSGNFQAIVDSGTGSLALPRPMVDTFFKTVKGASWNDKMNTYAFPCSSPLSDITIVINGYKAVVPARYLANGYLPNDKNTCISLMSATTGTAILGVPFIQSQFVVFDWAGARVGVAAKSLP